MLKCLGVGPYGSSKFITRVIETRCLELRAVRQRRRGSEIRQREKRGTFL
jgi:hypothetical protein